MTITIDVCPYTIVVYCSECGHWSRSAYNRTEAHDIAVMHEERVHPTHSQAYEARKAFLKRRGKQHAD